MVNGTGSLYYLPEAKLGYVSFLEKNGGSRSVYKTETKERRKIGEYFFTDNGGKRECHT